MILCQKCGRSKMRICFPPTPHCTCDPDPLEDRLIEALEKIERTNGNTVATHEVERTMRKIARDALADARRQ